MTNQPIAPIPLVAVCDHQIRVFEPLEVLSPTMVLGTIQLGLSGYVAQRRVRVNAPLLADGAAEAAQTTMHEISTVLAAARHVCVRIHSESDSPHPGDRIVEGEIYCDGEPLSRAVAMYHARLTGEMAL